MIKFLLENPQLLGGLSAILAAVIGGSIAIVVALVIYPRQRRIDQKFKIDEEKRQADAKLAEETRQADAKLSEEKRQADAKLSEETRQANVRAKEKQDDNYRKACADQLKNDRELSARVFAQGSLLAKELRAVRSSEDYANLRASILLFEEACVAFAVGVSPKIALVVTPYVGIIRELIWRVGDIQDPKKKNNRDLNFRKKDDAFKKLPSILAACVSNARNSLFPETSEIAADQIRLLLDQAASVSQTT